MPAENAVEESKGQAVNDEKEESNPMSEPPPRRPMTLDEQSRALRACQLCIEQGGWSFQCRADNKMKKNY